MTNLIESIIRRGIERGEFCDPHPDLTAQFVPGVVRSVMIDGLTSKGPEVITGHVLRFLQSSLLPSNSPQMQP